MLFILIPIRFSKAENWTAGKYRFYPDTNQNNQVRLSDNMLIQVTSILFYFFLYNLQKVGEVSGRVISPPLSPPSQITQELGCRKCNSRPSVVPLRSWLQHHANKPGLSTDYCKGQLTQVCPKDLSSTVNCRLLPHNAPHCQKTRSRQGGWWMKTNLSTLMEEKRNPMCATDKRLMENLIFKGKATHHLSSMLNMVQSERVDDS